FENSDKNLIFEDALSCITATSFERIPICRIQFSNALAITIP
ncbi:659_t:CDS:1, partial [Racocetra persica]